MIGQGFPQGLPVFSRPLPGFSVRSGEGLLPLSPRTPIPEQQQPQRWGATHAQKAIWVSVPDSQVAGRCVTRGVAWGFFLCLEDMPVPIRSAFPFRKLSGFPEDREHGERGRQKSPVKKPPCLMQSLNHSFPPLAARPSGPASTRPDAEAGTRPLRSPSRKTSLVFSNLRDPPPEKLLGG